MIVSNLFLPKPAPAPAPSSVPTPKPAAPMPDADSPAAREAARRSQMRMLSRGGRTSTILTAPEDRERSFSSSKLG